jgi:hypothetical protein
MQGRARLDEDLKDRLAHSGGVICTPQGLDPDIRRRAKWWPDAGDSAARRQRARTEMIGAGRRRLLPNLTAFPANSYMRPRMQARWHNPGWGPAPDPAAE